MTIRRNLGVSETWGVGSQFFASQAVSSAPGPKVWDHSSPAVLGTLGHLAVLGFSRTISDLQGIRTRYCWVPRIQTFLEAK